MYLCVAITKKKVFVLRSKILSYSSCLTCSIWCLKSRHAKYIVTNVLDFILLVLWFINLRKYIEKNRSVCIWLLSLHGMLYLVHKSLYMLLLFRWDGFSLLWFGLLRLLSGYLGCNLWPSWANIRLSKPLLLVKTVKNTSNNMDRFAYSL